MGLCSHANESRAIGASRAVVIVRVANHDGVLCGMALSDEQLPQTSGFIRGCPHCLNKELRTLPAELVEARHWIFDAVYVPAVTEFIAAAKQVGAAVVSGVSLFVFQGVDAFKFFCEDDAKREAAAQQSATLFAHYRRQLLKENDA